MCVRVCTYLFVSTCLHVIKQKRQKLFLTKQNRGFFLFCCDYSTLFDYSLHISFTDDCLFRNNAAILMRAGGEKKPEEGWVRKGSASTTADNKTLNSCGCFPRQLCVCWNRNMSSSSISHSFETPHFHTITDFSNLKEKKVGSYCKFIWHKSVILGYINKWKCLFEKCTSYFW